MAKTRDHRIRPEVDPVRGPPTETVHHRPPARKVAAIPRRRAHPLRRSIGLTEIGRGVDKSNDWEPFHVKRDGRRVLELRTAKAVGLFGWRRGARRKVEGFETTNLERKSGGQALRPHRLEPRFT